MRCRFTRKVQGRYDDICLRPCSRALRCPNSTVLRHSARLRRFSTTSRTSSSGVISSLAGFDHAGPGFRLDGGGSLQVAKQRSAGVLLPTLSRPNSLRLRSKGDRGVRTIGKRRRRESIEQIHAALIRWWTKFICPGAEDDCLPGTSGGIWTQKVCKGYGRRRRTPTSS
jgi:hypothetical protein